MSGVIKVCLDPTCEAVYHNCSKKLTRCNDCGGRILQINAKTYWNKFSKNWFQYDAESMEYYRPDKPKLEIGNDENPIH